jgi:hypothetical protein
LRTARIGLVSAVSPIQITIFPMVHIGEAAFFDAVYRDAFAHDTVLVEGVNSPIVNRITRSYRWIEGVKRLGLCVQPPYPRSSDVHAVIVHADLLPAEFTKVWRAVPIWSRAVVYVAAPTVGLRHRWFGTRDTLAQGMSLEDLPRREETLSWAPETVALTTAIIEARDQRLVAVLREQLDRLSHQSSRIAILYGAHHIRAVLRELSRRGYYVTDSKWLTVFSPS